jgi:uncharacterized protein YdhG (YjbR/CyaY superfamily)
MAQRKTAKDTRMSGRGASPKARGGLTAEEKAAMRETLADQRRMAAGADSEGLLLEKIAAMKEPDRSMARRIHAIVKANAPALTPKTWYGMPAYANEDGKAVVFFQAAAKFKARYATLGFNDTAHLDDGEMWPTSFALKRLTVAEEAKIAALVKKAVR